MPIPLKPLHRPLLAAVSDAGEAGLPPPASQPRRVLVVDDNRDAADTLALLLELLGHEIRTANDGTQALEAAEAFRPDVVLLDIGLPGMNGYEVCRRLREKPWGESMLIVALTGWGQAEDQRMASEAGFDRHLVKPVEEAVLLKLLEDGR